MLISIYNMADLLSDLERFTEVEPLALECERLNQQVFGYAHPETIDAINLLINLYTAWHDAEPHAELWRAKLPRGDDDDDG